MNFREAWAEGEIEAGALLDEIDRLRAELAAEREQCAEEVAMLRRLVRSYEHQAHRSVNDLEFGA